MKLIKAFHSLFFAALFPKFWVAYLKIISTNVRRRAKGKELCAIKVKIKRLYAHVMYKNTQ